jgi:hypothetical protein
MITVSRPSVVCHAAKNFCLVFAVSFGIREMMLFGIREMMLFGIREMLIPAVSFGIREMFDGPYIRHMGRRGPTTKRGVGVFRKFSTPTRQP